MHRGLGLRFKVQLGLGLGFRVRVRARCTPSVALVVEDMPEQLQEIWVSSVVYDYNHHQYRDCGIRC